MVTLERPLAREEILFIVVRAGHGYTKVPIFLSPPRFFLCIKFMIQESF
jgi:hypothetical protein